MPCMQCYAKSLAARRGPSRAEQYRTALPVEILPVRRPISTPTSTYIASTMSPNKKGKESNFSLTRPGATSSPRKTRNLNPVKRVQMNVEAVDLSGSKSALSPNKASVLRRLKSLSMY